MTREVRRISDALKVRASHQRDSVAHDDTRRALTFGEWDREADEVAGGLVAAGLEPGDRVFLPISNAFAVEHAIAVFATFRAGGIAVPINTRFSPGEVREYAELIEPRFAITDKPELLEGLSLTASWHADAMPRDISALPDQAALDPRADAEILATSGTTGRIKGVVVSHPDLMHGVSGTNMDRSRSTLHALPFTGSGGNLGVLMLPARGGATTYTQPKFDPAQFLELVRIKRPDTVYLVPSMLRLILDQPNVADYDFEGVRYLMTGTAPLPHDSVARTMALWPHVNMRNSYGMSEGGISIMTRSREQLLKPGCVGAMPAHMQLRDENDQVITARNQVGEICGWQKHSRRYWRDDQATEASFREGWTRSGDLGFVDDDGDLILCGRSKELIIRGGYNIAPLDIETVLHEHPAVREAAVVGIKHEVLGEDVAAAVSVSSGASVEEGELAEWCRARLADNKVPRTFLILDELPHNPSGKVLKRELLPLLEARAAERKAARAG